MFIDAGCNMTTDMTLMHLMCAKICHDLSAPAGAVAMGLEMLSEAPQDPQTRELVAFSSHSTIAKLELFRCLTGFSTMANKPNGVDLEKTLRNYWPENKITVTWKVPQLEDIQGPPARLLLATLLTAADGLPRGGNLTVEPNLSITAEGPTANLREESAKAITGNSTLSQQTVGTIVPFFAYSLAQNLGGKLQIKTMAENKFQIQMVG
jgi:histidine phosphotransferase ChpT